MIEVIAEIANAHQGSYKTAIKLAKQAFLIIDKVFIRQIADINSAFLKLSIFELRTC